MKPNLGGHKFKGESEVEAFVTRWLTVQVAGFGKQGMEKIRPDTVVPEFWHGEY
jgi:hypothetical protein